MSDQAFERYREALRQGHLAAIREDHAAAASAYGDATGLAPDRPLPHVGQGTALLQLGSHAEALAAFDRALVIAPLDEAALRGRAAVLMALGRTVDASATLTGLAESLAADRRIAEALELAREALALAAAPARFRLVARLSAAIRTQGTRGARATDADALEVGVGAHGEPDDEDGHVRNGTTSSGSSLAIGVTLMAEGDALADAGQLDDAGRRYMLAARAHLEGGRRLAALECCHRALALVPAAPALHLVLAELYDVQGWQELAADKLLLLLRLVDETGDLEARERTCALATALYPDDSRLAAACR